LCFCRRRRRPCVVIHFSLSTNCRPTKRLCSFSMISDEEGRERPITTITTAATRRSRLIETTVVRRGVPDVVNDFSCSSHRRRRRRRRRQIFCDATFLDFL
jgi:hypothetical protein